MGNGKWTGYKDKSGRKIFDGNFIRNYQTGEAPNEPGIVFFDYGEWCYNCFHAGALPLESIYMDSVVVDDVKGE